MRSFKTVCFKGFTFVLLFWIVNELGFFLLEPYSYLGHYVSHDYVNKKGEIDTIFIGSSWTYFGYDTQIYNHEMEEVSFNAGTIGQQPIDSYYYLKMLVEENPIKKVFFNVSPLKLQTEIYPANSSVVWDRLDFKNKFEFVCHIPDLEMIKYFLSFHRYKESISLNYVFENVTKKLSANYKNYIPTKAVVSQIYRQDGHVSGLLSLPLGNTKDFTLTTQNWERSDIEEINTKYLDKIVELCKANDIELFIVTMPYTLGNQQTFSEHYSDYNGYFNEYCAKNQIYYYDFNYLENSPFTSNLLFLDCNHLNQDGAAIFTEYICKLLKSPGELSFHPSWDSYKKENDYCGAVKLEKLNRDENTYLVATVPDKTMLLEYRFLCQMPGSMEYLVIQDWGECNQVNLKSNYEKKALYRVEVRHINANYAYESYDILERNYIEYGNLVDLNYIAVDGQVLEASQYPFDVEYQFLQWRSDDTFEVIQDYSMNHSVSLNTPIKGMYRFKVIVRDKVTQKVIAERQLFIDTQKGD